MSRKFLEKSYKCAGVYIFTEDNKLLLVNHYKRGWSPPGGFVETSDLSPFGTICREFCEETLSNIPVLNYRDYVSCAFGSSCLLFVSKIKISPETEKLIVSSYDASKISNHETLDILFVPVNKLFTRQTFTGQKHGTSNRTASFLSRALRRMQAKGMLSHVIHI